MPPREESPRIDETATGASLMRAALEAVMDGWMPLVTLIALAGTFAIMVAWLVYA
jgi:hypothetical protein